VDWQKGQPLRPGSKHSGKKGEKKRNCLRGGAKGKTLAHNKKTVKETAKTAAPKRNEKTRNQGSALFTKRQKE